MEQTLLHTVLDHGGEAETGTVHRLLDMMELTMLMLQATPSSNAYFVGLTWQDMFPSDDRMGFAFGQ